MQRKSYHEYGFTNDVVFSTVLKDPNLCKQLLQRILPERKIKEVKLTARKDEKVETEKTVKYDIFAKGVRFDVLFQDDEAWYNVEMQCTKKKDIALRTRYYGSQIDMEQLGKGETYHKLKKRYVIFICTFDMFDLNRAMYRFVQYDIEHDLQLGDDTITIILNSKSTEEAISEELKSLFAYINNNEFDSEDVFLYELDSSISTLNREDGELRRSIMRLDEKILIEREEAKEEGKIEGIKEGIKTGKEVGANEAKIAIGKNLKNDGVPIEVIVKNTGLAKEEVEKL